VNSPSVMVPESFTRADALREFSPWAAPRGALFRVAWTMRYTYLRDWRGGLLLRCRLDPADGSPASRAALFSIVGSA
jgi:hypothetical protein